MTFWEFVLWVLGIALVCVLGIAAMAAGGHL